MSSPVSGQDDDPQADDHEDARSGGDVDRVAAGREVGERRAVSAKSVVELVDDEREVAERDDRQPGQPGRARPPAAPARAAAPRVGDEQRADDRQQRDAEDVALHRDGRPDRGQRATSAARPVVQARHAPASATALDRAMRFGFQMNVDSSIADAETAMTQAGHEPGDRPGDRPRQPPRRRPTAAIPARAISSVTASGNRRRTGTPPGRAGSSRARRGGSRRSRSAARAAARRRRGRGPQDEHVVALVGVPGAPRREVRQAQHARRAPGARAGPRARSPGDRRRAGATAPAVTTPLRRRGSGGPVRARLPRDRQRLGRQVGERPPGRQVAGPGHVDRVVALVHAGRLEVVGRRARGAGWRQDRRQARRRRSGRPRGARGGRHASRAPTSSR